MVEVATPSPSPFARSLLFGYVGMFLYEADAPLAERRAAALSLDSTLLAELLGSEAIRELLDPEVLAEVEASLQRLAPDRHARDVEGAADLLRFLGDLTTAEAAARGVRRGVAGRAGGGAAGRSGCGSPARSAGCRSRTPAGCATRSGAALPVGVPETFTEPVTDPLGDLLLRYARTHGPFPAAEAAARFGLGRRGGRRGARPAGRRRAAGPRRAAARRLARRGRRRSSTATPRCCAGCGGRRWPGCGPRSSRSSRARWAGSCRPGRGCRSPRRRPAGPDAAGARAPRTCSGVVEQLAGAPLPASALESLILPARLPGYTPALLDELTAAGEVTWTGCGPLAGVDGWLALAPGGRRRPAAARAGAGHGRPLRCTGPCWPRRLDRRRRRWRAVLPRARRPRRAAPCSTAGSRRRATTPWSPRSGIWCGPGCSSNDTLGPLRARLGGVRRRAAARRTAPGARPRAAATPSCGPGRPAMPSRGGPPSVGGRWALAPRPGARPDPPGARPRRGVPGTARRADPRRAGHRAGRPAGSPAVYRVLRAMEDSGRARRGYVVEGLGAAQFAVPGAIDRLRALSRPDGAASRPRPPDDTAPHRDRAAGGGSAGSCWPRPTPPSPTARRWPGRPRSATPSTGRVARRARSSCWSTGAPALYVERGGRSLLSFTDRPRTSWRPAAQALAGAVHEGWLGTLAVERADGVGSLGSELAEVLTEAGFRVTPKGLRLRA